LTKFYEEKNKKIKKRWICKKVLVVSRKSCNFEFLFWQGKDTPYAEVAELVDVLS
jgi:hypothetical protein